MHRPIKPEWWIINSLEKFVKKTKDEIHKKSVDLLLKNGVIPIPEHIENTSKYGIDFVLKNINFRRCDL